MSTNSTLPLAEERPTIPLWPDAGRAYDLGRSASYEAAKRGDIPCIRIGRRWVAVTALVRKQLGLDGPPAGGDAA